MDTLIQLEAQPFAHEALALGGNSIRLVTLHPDRNEYSILNCTIEQHALHRRPGYIALSYTWGTTEGQFPMLLNGKAFYIRRNLHDCLVHLRKLHDQPITLWIDALCIDQNNTPERNHVVQLMDQVYERSDQVYVWLGPGDTDSDEAMTFLDEITAWLQTEAGADDKFGDTYMFPPAHYQNWVTVLRLFKNVYWSRLWIIQETLLAPSLEIFCGNRRISWNKLQRIVLLVKHFYSEYKKKRSDKSDLFFAIVNSVAVRMVLRRCDSTAFGGSRDSYPSLQRLLENFKDSDCYEAKDGVFGLLSIASDFYQRRIDYIDYHLRSTQVFTQFLPVYIQLADIHDSTELFYNIRRLSDALRINPYSNILTYRTSSAKESFQDLQVHHSDLLLPISCRNLAKFYDGGNSKDFSIPHCMLTEFSDSNITNSQPMRRFSQDRSAMFTSDSSEEILKLRTLSYSEGYRICNALPLDTNKQDFPTSNHQSISLKCFIQTGREYDEDASPCFGLACPASQTGDLLVKCKESDLTFVARPHHTGSDRYDIVGTAIIHEDSDPIAEVKSSFRKMWSRFDAQTQRYTRKLSLTSPISPKSPLNQLRLGGQTTAAKIEDYPLENVYFNPLMLLMIVNEPNWRKNETTAGPDNLVLQRHTNSYVAIQPRGDDDPDLKSFGMKAYTGHAHIDRAANKFRNRTSIKYEVFKDKVFRDDDSGSE